MRRHCIYRTKPEDHKDNIQKIETESLENFQYHNQNKNPKKDEEAKVKKSAEVKQNTNTWGEKTQNANSRGIV